MHDVDGRDRVVASASKLITGLRKIGSGSKTTIQIKCWGIVWATPKFRYYSDKHEFDLYADHKVVA
ncbi:hypothetical protein L915_12819 [Phytophthora nicotianae]|uniref:Reverse transcriptase RNase H-like domain-containing protein n=2 Tax=Phytophthora nicotianae TaxID=4792 RepID=V9ES27_PHYNI|nr:hypothetical protein F443_13124 [Phytophthora nicotianae P1569]ETK81700.1 hypothetical protein L915_12819 [Phytophthora nicotianae]